MKLSNTAVPKYYAEFRDAVIRGEIPVNEFMSLEMNRIDARIADPDVYYDPLPVEAFIRYCEQELVLTDGSPFVMTDPFKLWAEQVYCWYVFEERKVYSPKRRKYRVKKIRERLIKVQYLIVGRGAAKTLYLSCQQSYWQNCKPKTTDGVAVAPTIRQAEETLTPLNTAITRCPGPYFKFLTQGSAHNTTGAMITRPKLLPGRDKITNALTNSVIRTLPMSIHKLQGLRCQVGTLDEWLSGELRENPITAIEQGASKNPDYLLVAASSEGNVRNGSGDAIKMELIKILRGEIRNDHISIFYYCLDDVAEVGNPSKWVKANPNLGITVSYDTYQQEVEKAEKVPEVRNEILAKRFGIPAEGFTYFFTYEETMCHPHHEFFQMQCALGVDLSRGDDFCAFTFLFPLSDGTFGVKVRSYITEYTYSSLHEALRAQYDKLVRENSLIIMPGTELKIPDVYEDLMAFVDKCGYDICALGYDPYNADVFIKMWTEEHGPLGTEVVKQGSRTESVPLGELKKLAEQRALIFDQELMHFCMGNAITLQDTNGNRKLSKERRDKKIDNVSALMDAYVAYSRNPDLFEGYYG
jgi:phage terminase large subunit-like protein